MKTIIFVICSCCLAVALQAQVIHVPADYSTIQQGINAANPGDTVLVSDGTYNERINFMGKKPLTVASEFIKDNDWSHILNTIIDGSSFTTSDQLSVVSFVSGEDTTSTLCGFTIRNGKGTVYYSGNMSNRAGGGIFISNSGARIIHNHITQNHLSYSLFGTATDVCHGGGIGVASLMDTSWVIIEHNTVDYNSVTSNAVEASGAGMSILCNARLDHNVISSNTSKGELNCRAWDGGFTCAAWLEWNINLTMVIRGNTISNNLVQADNNSAACGGAGFQHVKTIFQGNTVSDNEAYDNSTGGGGIGGVAFVYPLEGTIVSGNTFTDNTSDAWCGALDFEAVSEETYTFRIPVENNYFLNNHADESGGALASYNIPLCIQNNVFIGNSALDGGAILLWRNINTVPFHHVATLINNSFYGNSADRGGAIFSYRTKPLVFNCIFSNDSAAYGPEIYAPYSTDTIEIANSDIDFSRIYGNIIDGSGNINQDPLFDDLKLLTISPNSPCMDAGTESFTCDCGVTHSCPQFDMSGNPRPQSEGVEMGAYELMFAGVQPVSGQQSAVSSHPNPTSGVFNCQLPRVNL